MHVLHLISSSGFAGAEQQILQLTRELRRLGCQAEILILHRRPPNLSRDHRLVVEANAQGIPAYELNDPTRLSVHNSWKVVNVLQQGRFDLLHTHDYKADVLGALIARLAGIPSVATVHGLTDAYFWVKVYQQFDLLALRFHSRVIAVSSALRDDLIAQGLSPAKVIMVHNAIDLTAFAANVDPTKTRSDLHIVNGFPIVTMVGRLSPEKGHHVLLQCAPLVLRRIPVVHFLIIGQGKLEGPLKHMASLWGLADSVSFLGHRDDVPSLIKLSDVVVLPSLREGLPITLLEALALERPVVASAVGGVPEVIRDGETGYLVPSADPERLATAIINVLTDRQKAARMAQRGRQYVQRRFVPEKMACETLQVYQCVLDEH